mmetsp:Transcript_20259/g.47298  ORF Transcript_20259/g.47298 Transcript_20259/m.47298 type:complete len:573 (+) Transcript_20259:170-1888(+)
MEVISKIEQGSDPSDHVPLLSQAEEAEQQQLHAGGLPKIAGSAEDRTEGSKGKNSFLKPTRAGAVLLIAMGIVAWGGFVVTRRNAQAQTLSSGSMDHAMVKVTGQMYTGVVKEVPLDDFAGSEFNQVELKSSDEGLSFTSLTDNNLAEFGPNANDPPWMRFSNALELVNGDHVDLIVQQLHAFDHLYYPKDASKNGEDSAGNAQINTRGGTFPTFRFRFVRKGTHDPVTLNRFFMNVYDIDNGGGGSTLREQVCAGYYQYVYMVHGTKLDLNVRDGLQDPCVISTVEDSGENNPAMSASQLEISVGMSFVSTSEFDIYFGTPDGNKNNGRNVFFGSTPSPYLPCFADTMPANVTFTGVATGHSNLGGQGPDSSSPETLLYSNVWTEGSQAVDLVVSAGSGYAGDVSRNGVAGHFGRINMQSGIAVDFTFKFVESGTSTPVDISNLMFSFFDIDQSSGGASQETIKVGGFDHAFVSNLTEVSYTDNGDGTWTFASSQEDAADKVPSHPMFISTDEQKQTVTLEFESASEFTLKFDLTGGDSSESRDLLFAGISRLNANSELGVICPVSRTRLR